MASSTFLRRTALILLPAASLVSCIGDGMAPSAEVATTRPLFSSGRKPEGRVADRELLGPVEASSADARQPVGRESPAAAADYVDTPNVAGVDNRADEDPLGVNDPRGVKVLAAPGEPIASAEQQPSLLREQALPQPMPLAAEYSIPAEGVNIDADLGVGDESRTDRGEAEPQAAAAPVAAQIMVPQGPVAIAEGETTQPVVDGIGTDNPTALTPRQPQVADPSLAL